MNDLVKNYKTVGKLEYYGFGNERSLLFTDKKLSKGSYMGVSVDKLPLPNTIKAVNSNGKELKAIGVTSYGLIVFEDNKDTERYTEATITFDEAPLPLPVEVFNTVKGIDNYIHTLKDLNEIIEARRIYGKIYKNRMPDFVFNKTVYLDTFGQSWIFNEITFENSDVYRLDRVVTLQELQKYGSNFSYGSGKYVPHYTETCEQCGETYTLNDLRNISATWYSEKMMHNGCIGHHYYEKERDTIEQMVSEVYPNCSYKGIRSKYYSDGNGHNRPWFKIKTPDGEVMVGKRKRVYHIEWLESYKSFTEKFKTEDVTKGFGSYDKERYIHAWSKEEVVKYLKLAKESIE